MSPRELPKRTLGRAGVSVTALGLGGAPLGEPFATLPEPQADAVVEVACESGIRLYDTAPWYGHGLSEHRIGRTLRQRDRASFVLSTKVGRVYSRPRAATGASTAPWAGGIPFELRFDYGRDGILRSYEDSLQRLGLNRVDLLVIHDLDPGYHAPEEVLESHRTDLEKGGWRALEELRSGGEVRGLGAGINDPRMMRWFLDRFELDFFLVAMPYTLLDSKPLREFQACLERDISIIIGAPFASGILATGPGEGATYGYAAAEDAVLDKTRRIQEICSRHEVPLAAAALQFPLGHSAVAAVIPGATRGSFVEANRGHLLLRIPAELWQELEAEALLAPDAPVPEPHWQTAAAPASRTADPAPGSG